MAIKKKYTIYLRVTVPVLFCSVLLYTYVILLLHVYRELVQKTIQPGTRDMTLCDKLLEIIKKL